MDEVVKGINLNKFAISWIAIEQYRAIYDKQVDVYIQKNNIVM